MQKNNGIGAGFGTSSSAKVTQRVQLALSSLLLLARWIGVVAFLTTTASAAANLDPALGPTGPGYVYFHEEIPTGPWATHVLKVARNRPELAVDTALGHGNTIGLAMVSQQVTMIPPLAGKPVGAINGDFYEHNQRYPGDPEGIQIVRGELVSGPNPERACFWVDAQRGFHRTNVASLFHVVWPSGAKTPFGLNEEREDGAATLYTAAIGPSTRCYGGRELVLAAQTNSWLPLQAGKTYLARVKAINETGNTRLTADIMVLAIGPRLTSIVPKIEVGTVIKVCTATAPELTGATAALGGGPTLVSAGKASQWKSWFLMRHPRSAIGWNKDYFFLVEVDGRQTGSIGMSFPELAQYMIKLGCEEALNMDGGGSATLWVDGRVVNSPCTGYERAAANAVVVLRKPKP